MSEVEKYSILHVGVRILLTATQCTFTFCSLQNPLSDHSRAIWSGSSPENCHSIDSWDLARQFSCTRVSLVPRVHCLCPSGQSSVKRYSSNSGSLPPSRISLYVLLIWMSMGRVVATLLCEVLGSRIKAQDPGPGTFSRSYVLSF